MPKIVDHDQRRHEIAAAMWRVLYRDGIEAVTVRSVATEAGLSKATLGHYFASHNDLLMFAMVESIAATITKLRKLNYEALDFETATKAVIQGVPTTAQRRTQSEIWLAVVSRSQADPNLRAHLSETNVAVADEVRLFLSALQKGGLMAPDRDLALETQRLHALIDGMTLHTLTDSRQLSGSRIRMIVNQHLTDLGNPGPKMDA